MNRCPSTPRPSGFALTESLVSLLLLAIALLGAGTALMASLSGQRAALFQTHAADLAGDLAEALRAAPRAADRVAEVDAWRVRASSLLPHSETALLPHVASALPAGSQLPASHDISLHWRDSASSLSMQMLLPLSLPATGTP